MILIFSGWLMVSLLAGQQTPYYISDLAPSFMLILTGVVVFLVGPVIFGSEYAEGAKDFLHSRPVSETKVFWSKATTLMAFSLLSAFCLCYCLNRNPMTALKPFMFYIIALWSVFLAISFWCSAATVLSRDLVRGILYGSVSLAIAGTVIGWFWFVRIIPWLSGMSDDYDYRSLHLTNVYGGIALALIPCAILSILRMVHSWEARKQLHLHKSSLMFMFLFLAWFVPMLFVIRNDGKAIYAGRDQVSEVFGKSLRGNRLYLLHGLWGRMEKPAFKKLALSSVDLMEQEGVPAPATILETTFGTGLAITEVHFTENRLQITGTMRSPEKTLVSFRRVFSFPDGHLISMEDGVGDQNTSSVSQGKLSLEIESGSRLYRISDLEKPVPFAIKIYDRSGGTSSATSTAEIPLLASAVCDGNLLAGFETSPSEGRYPWAFLGGPLEAFRLFCQDLVLLDTTQPAQPKRVVIRIPDRLWKPFAFLEYAFDDHKQSSVDAPVLSLGGGYLCVWFRMEQVVGVWDISRPEEPHFVGSALPQGFFGGFSETCTDMGFPPHGLAISGPTTPLRRADGALGFVRRDGLLWLEFPALMKGERS
jgi:hypothetical protein